MRFKAYITEGKEGIERLLASLGFDKNMKPLKIEKKKYECPACKKKEAVYVEEHPDTDMNEIVLKCPCGYSE